MKRSGKKLKTISIAFTENGEAGGKGFEVYITGSERDLNKTAQKDMTPAEYWAISMFGMIVQVLIESGTAKEAFPNPHNTGLQ